MHARSQFRVVQFQGVVMAGLQLGDPRRVDVITQHIQRLAKLNRQRQAYIAQPDDRNPRLSRGSDLGTHAVP